MKSFRGRRRQEPTFYLDLVDQENGDVALVVVDKEGNKIPGGTIASITKEGEMIVHGCLNTQSGLKTGVIDTTGKNRGHISVTFR